jgi:heat shock protein HslJ
MRAKRNPALRGRWDRPSVTSNIEKGETGMRAILFSLIVVIVGSTSIFAKAADIEGIQWTLTYANGREVTAAMAYFQIDPNGKFTGSTGCNRMFGNVEVRAQKITFSNIGTTKKMCKLMAGAVAEPDFLDALSKANRYERDGNILHIYDRRGRTLMRFRRLVKQAPVEEPVSLENRKWVLESIKNRKTLVPIKGAFVNFDAVKKSAGGDSSCNVFGGEYRTNGSRIKITEIVSTMRACVEDGRMTVEREFLDGLRATNRYEIKDGRLLLYRGQNLLLTLRSESKS